MVLVLGLEGVIWQDRMRLTAQSGHSGLKMKMGLASPSQLMQQSSLLEEATLARLCWEVARWKRE